MLCLDKECVWQLSEKLLTVSHIDPEVLMKIRLIKIFILRSHRGRHAYLIFNHISMIVHFHLNLSD